MIFRVSCSIFISSELYPFSPNASSCGICGMQLNAIWHGKISTSTFFPSRNSRLSRRSSSIAARLTPPTDWNVVTTILRILAASCSGFRATTIWMVEQFGLAMIPWCFLMSAALTSGTTSGTSLSIRQALELSTTTHPAFAEMGANSRLTSFGTLKRATSHPSKDFLCSSSTRTLFPLNLSAVPAPR